MGNEFEERKNRFATVSNFEVKRLYRPEDIDDVQYAKDLGDPGEFPFTRGIYSTMYRGQLWTMRQFAGFGTPEETNDRYHYLLEQGQTGLSVAFDMPSLMGIDSDHEMSEGEVGKEGVAVDTLEDMKILFDGIPLNDVSVSFTINPSAPIVFAMFVALFDERGLSRDQINATFQNDMLKEFIAQKEWVIPPEPSMELVVDTIEFAIKETPKVKPVSISGYHIREAGSTAVQELAFTIADGLAYVEACEERGMEVDDFVPQFSFFFNSHNSIFEEVAKFRAARRMWAEIIHNDYEAERRRSKTMKFHTQTAGQSLTAQQPLNNIVRTTIQALAGVLGGTQSLHTNSFDEAHALPTERAVKVALRTQQIIAEESGAADVVDPLGGSYFVEKLTDDIAKEAREYLKKIRSMGDGSIMRGVLDGIREGWFQREIRDSAFEYQKRVENEEEIVVGVNEFEDSKSSSDREDMEFLHVDEQKAQKQQRQRLNTVKEKRDQSEVEDSLDNLRRSIKNSENTMPQIIDAVKNYASMEEIMQIFKTEFGEYHESSVV